MRCPEPGKRGRCISWRKTGLNFTSQVISKSCTPYPLDPGADPRFGFDARRNHQVMLFISSLRLQCEVKASEVMFRSPLASASVQGKKHQSDVPQCLASASLRGNSIMGNYPPFLASAPVRGGSNPTPESAARGLRCEVKAPRRRKV